VGSVREKVVDLDHVAIARKYVRDVLRGKIVACKETQQACERQARDEKDGPKRGLRFNEDKANDFLYFGELMPHIKGEWAKRGELIRWEPWQSFICTTLFGWQRQTEAGRWVRRFTRAYEEVARKNAKSTKLAVACNYCTFVEGEAGAEGYAAATKKDQAKIVVGDAWDMARRCVEFQERFGVKVLGSREQNPRLVQSASSSVLSALASDSNNLDGLNPHFIAVDEFHAHKTRELWDVLDSATGAREEPLIWIITTAGSDETGVCYDTRKYVRMILDGLVDDDSWFGIIYTLDEGDDWKDPKNWPKANPNQGVSKKVADMEAGLRKALTSPATAANFQMKQLNIWVSAANAWANKEDWKACVDHSLDLEQMRGLPCYIGLDLASKVDIAAVELLFPWALEDGRQGFKLFHRFYLPEETVKEEALGSFAHYATWAEQGHLILTPGYKISLPRIQEDLERDIASYKVLEIDHDPWQAAQMVDNLSQLGVTCVEVQPSVRNFSEPMKEAEALAKEGLLRIAPNPAFLWQIGNVTAKEDYKENVYPRKEAVTKKIDAFVAMLSALNGAVFRGGSHEGGSVYEGRGIVSV
jgi:phage terminase large subunit-like protein